MEESRRGKTKRKSLGEFRRVQESAGVEELLRQSTADLVGKVCTSCRCSATPFFGRKWCLSLEEEQK